MSATRPSPDDLCANPQCRHKRKHHGVGFGTVNGCLTRHDTCTAFEEFVNVDLWDSHEVGLIIPWQTGVLFSNQVGGHACAHPKLEGFLLPVPVCKFTWMDPLLNAHLLDYAPTLVQKLLTKTGLDEWLEPLTTDDKPEEMSEAWVWVRIRKPDTLYSLPVHLQPFAGTKAVLTYPNSD